LANAYGSFGAVLKAFCFGEEMLIGSAEQQGTALNQFSIEDIYNSRTN
jgi:hypothetical protein